MLALVCFISGALEPCCRSDKNFAARRLRNSTSHGEQFQQRRGAHHLIHHRMITAPTIEIGWLVCSRTNTVTWGWVPAHSPSAVAASVSSSWKWVSPAAFIFPGMRGYPTSPVSLTRTSRENSVRQTHRCGTNHPCRSAFQQVYFGKRGKSFDLLIRLVWVRLVCAAVAEGNARKRHTSTAKANVSVRRSPAGQTANAMNGRTPRHYHSRNNRLSIEGFTHVISSYTSTTAYVDIAYRRLRAAL